jgi:hypothetical protein
LTTTLSVCREQNWKFLTVDPDVADTGQPYAYAEDDPVNGSDPSGLCVSLFNVVCVGGGSVTSTLSFRFDPTAGAEGLANFGAGFANTVVSTATLGHVQVPQPFCGDTLHASYDLGSWSPFILLGGDADAGGGEYGQTPEGRPFTQHYGTETGPIRNIPGSIVDQTINDYPGVPGRNGTTIHYDPNNNVTVVTGRGGSIVSARKGPP